MGCEGFKPESALSKGNALQQHYCSGPKYSYTIQVQFSSGKSCPGAAYNGKFNWLSTKWEEKMLNFIISLMVIIMYYDMNELFIPVIIIHRPFSDV